MWSEAAKSPRPWVNWRGASGTLLIADLDDRKLIPFGTADYHVPDDPTQSYQAANPIIVATGKNAKGEVRFYYPAVEQK